MAPLRGSPIEGPSSMAVESAVEMEGLALEGLHDDASVKEPLVPVPPSVSKKTLATWKKQLKNLKTKDAGKKIDGLRYAAQDEQFVREQAEVLPLLMELLGRVKMPEVIAETLRTFTTLFTKHETTCVRPLSATEPPLPGASGATPLVVALHPEQNRQFTVEASRASSKNAWKGGNPFVALFSANVSPEIKIQAIEVFTVLLTHCMELAASGGTSDPLLEYQTVGGPTSALLSCLATDHAELQLAALDCLCLLFQHPPNAEFLTTFHSSDGLRKIQRFVERADRRFHAGMLKIAESFSHFEIGREYLRTTGVADTVRIVLTTTLDTTTSTIAAATATPTATIPLTTDEAALMHENVSIAVRTYVRVLFARENRCASSLSSFTDGYESVPAVVETLISILQRDITNAVSPPPPPAAAGTNAAAQAAAAAAAATAAALASLFPFSSTKCVEILTGLGRMVEASHLVQRYVKSKELLPVLLLAFRVPDDDTVHQCADKLLHLCARLYPTSTDGGFEQEAVAPVDPQLFGVGKVASSEDAESGSLVDAGPLVSLDNILPILETVSTASSSEESKQEVVFRLVRWLALAVDAPSNAHALGESTINVILKIFLETKSSATVLCGFLTKCIQAIACQNPDACELCSSENRNPVAAIAAFMQTAYPPVEYMPAHRAASVSSEIESLAIGETCGGEEATIITDSSSEYKLEWTTEFDEPDTFEPHSLTKQCHTFDPFLFAAKTLEIFASAYARVRTTSTDNATVDFAELLTQRLDPSQKTVANATMKKKATTGDVASKPPSTGEAIVLCVLERVADVFKLLGMFSSKNGEVAVSLLTTIRWLLELPGGVRATLTLAKTTVDALPVVPASDGEEPGTAEAVTTHQSNSSAWPWTREEARQTEHGWLLAPILSVFETSVTCFFQLEAAVAVLTAIIDNGPPAPAIHPPPASGVISSVEITIDDTDRFMNAALSHGILVYLIAILDVERVPLCPKASERRQDLVTSVVALALRLIERGTIKQTEAITRRQELLDLHDQLATAAVTAVAAGTKNAKPDAGPTIDAASLHNQKLEFQSKWASELLNATFDVPRFGYRRIPALLLAIQIGQDEIARALLTAGVAPDAPSSLDSTTPLMLALLTKNKPLAIALLGAGASVDAITQDGLDVAVWMCALTAPVRDDLFTLISRVHSSKVASTFVLPLDTLIELDSEEGSLDIELFSMLLQKGLDVNVSNAEGDFVLHALLSQCVVRKRMRGLDLCFRYRSSRHIDSAVLLKLVKSIVENHRADINACNMLGQTPLHAALLYGHASAALYLLEKGANPNIRDLFGLLPIHYACLGFFDNTTQAIDVVETLLVATTKHELIQGVHTDHRKYKTPLEKEVVEVEALLERGYADVRAPPELTRTLATVEHVLASVSAPPDGFLPWHLTCGACSHLNGSSFCLTDEMNSKLLFNSSIRAAILELLVNKYGVSLETRTTKQLTGLHIAVKTDVDGSNAAVIDVLLSSKALANILNAVHEPTTIDTLLPIEEGGLVELTTDALLYVPHAHVSTRSFQHQYHVILPDGNHLQGLGRHQLTRSPSSTYATPSSVASRYTLLMESGFSALHYALQTSDGLSRRLLDLPGVALQPEGSDLPCLALACAARRSPDIVARLVNPQVNMRVYLPLHDGTSHEQASDGGSTAGGSASSRAASRKQAAALHFAVIYEDIDQVRALVTRKDHTNVNVRRSGDGFTPLHLACGMGNMDIIKLLLDVGANLIQMSTVSSISSGVTPLHLLIKNDSVQNDKLRELIRDGYVTREMLLEGLGAPAVVSAKAPSKQDESRDAAATDGALASGNDGGFIGGGGEGEIEISCVLLDEEEHNLSLFNYVDQLNETKRGTTAYALRLQSELTKSDGVLSLFFRLISGVGEASDGRNSSLANVAEEDLDALNSARSARPSQQEEGSVLEARHQFMQLKHWHDCYAQHCVRSQWVEAKPSAAKTMRRSSFDRRSTQELLRLSTSDAIA